MNSFGTNTASSINFMNRIKSLESKSKRTTTPFQQQQQQIINPTQINIVNSSTYQQQQQQPKTNRNNNELYDNSYLNFQNNNTNNNRYTSGQTGNDRKPSEPQSQTTKYRLNIYQDKVPDQKFFNRNYKPPEMLITNRQMNDSPTTSGTNTDIRLNSATDKNLQSNSMNLNKLKLLKKRNALKKTLSNVNQQQQTNTSSLSKSHQNFDYNYTLITTSKEDFKSQTSLNNLTNKAYSMHLSRNSLNNTESNLGGSNQNILIHKSSETIDELHLSELRGKAINNLNGNLNRVRSTPHINNNSNQSLIQNSIPVINGRTKSENELVNLPEANMKPRVKTVTQIGLFNNKTNSKSRPVSRMDKSKTDNSSTSTNKAKESDSEEIRGGINVKNESSKLNGFDMKLGIDGFEPSPYNIMSDPVISEQFRKLYEEDEYFQQVHRKCCEWLNKYVFPEIENHTYGISNGNTSTVTPASSTRNFR
ncbi:unnamed protein product [Brachionus calyciflorus]|uniref:Uncharacterized protein n=1 Tax=Brachionus calyciflorus TaxID=104777 RepID=A0A813SL33_9BILA|nr:unnamed protein product [Brachionus calyciflorus]